MNEKRFGETERNCYYTSLVFDNQTQEKLGTDKVVDLLNELAEESEQLRHEIEIEKKWQLEKDKYYVKMKEENEMLKKRLSLYDEDEVDKYLRTHPMPTSTNHK